MDLLIIGAFVLGWYTIGFVTTLCIHYSDYREKEDYQFTGKDLTEMLEFSWLGLFLLIGVFIYLIAILVARVAKKMNNSTSKYKFRNIFSAKYVFVDKKKNTELKVQKEIKKL